MGRCRKKEILGLTVTMTEANDSVLSALRRNPQGLPEMLAQCQEAAMQIGANLEAMGNQYASAVRLLEDYCENIYQMSVSLQDENVCRKLTKKVRRQLTELQNRIRYEMPDDKKEVVFLPYKASMWDSLESVWKAADADENTDAYVIPIPYYDKNPDGSFREEHYEGSQYPAYVPVTWYEDYDFAERRPDRIYIHNAYDDCNYVTSVHPFFYSRNLKKFTDKLIYIPYFVLGEVNPQDKTAVHSVKHFCIVPGVFHADKVIVQSKEMRQVYINVLTEETLKSQNRSDEKEIRKYWEEKIDGSGSPKVDKVRSTRREDLEIPEEWRKVIQRPDGSWKKIIFYNTTVTALLQHNEQYLAKLREVLRFFYENREEAALLWRPHPLFVSTLESMRPQLGEEYRGIVEEYRKGGWGIYDDTPDIDRAVVICDAYYGDGSSVVQMCQTAGKPIMIQNPNVLDMTAQN